MLSKYAAMTAKSRTLYERAKKVLPGGVSYGIRYFEPYPFYTAKARGSKLTDVDGNEYIDFWLGHTALILGHSPLVVVEAAKKQIENGTHYGTAHEAEIALAEQVARMIPSAQMTRFTNSGTEANMYVARVARAHTGKATIAKFEGGWHGGYDALQIAVKYPFDLPESAGITTGAVQDTIVLPFNDFETVTKRLQNARVGAIIIEPVLGAGGGVPVEKDFLKQLRELCDDREILLIFDEVITGFRLAPGGAQQFYGVKPDLTVLGKILGGGFPVGAICGRREIMERLDAHIYERPKSAFQGGTFTANPITMAAGLATLRILQDGVLIRRLNAMGDKIRNQLRKIFETYGTNVQTVGEGSIFNVHFTKERVKDARSASRADKSRLLEYDLSLMANGVFFLPTHNGALSTAHTSDDVEKLFAETERYAKKSDNG